MLIYRVEHTTGFGPYSVSWVGNEGVWGGYSTGRQPDPMNDIGIQEVWNELTPDEQGQYSFGFADMDQFYQWFDRSSVRESLAKNGYVIKVYESSSVVVGGYQAIFKKPESEQKEIIDIPTGPPPPHICEKLIERGFGQELQLTSILANTKNDSEISNQSSSCSILRNPEISETRRAKARNQRRDNRGRFRKVTSYENVLK
jgi:hypothetical protein